MAEPPKTKRVKLNVAIDRPLKEVVVEVAAKEGRSLSTLVSNAVTDYVRRRALRPPLRFRREGDPG